ncbi:SDR family oxidoreductase [Salibacterium sp. K-3]
MTRYLVTGGAGFVGSHIVKALAHRGDHVAALDNFSTGNKNRWKELRGKVECIEGDITDKSTLEAVIQKGDVIFHEAALPSVPKSVKAPLRTNEVNITGTLNVLQTAVENKADRVIYAASSSAYGDSEVLPKREEMKTEPLSPYGVAKYAGEHYCRAYHAVFGLQTISLRYFNVFGPSQDPHSEYAAVIPGFIEAVLNDRRPVIYGDGTQSRDFTYVDNVVLANLLAAEADGLKGQVVNIGTGERITVNELAEAVNACLGKNTAPRYEPARPGDVKHSLADTNAASSLLGYQPTVSFQEGLKRTVEWYKENNSG